MGPTAITVFKRDIQTNNFVESYHSSLLRLIKPYPKVWEFLMAVKYAPNTSSILRYQCFNYKMFHDKDKVMYSVCDINCFCEQYSVVVFKLVLYTAYLNSWKDYGIQFENHWYNQLLSLENQQLQQNLKIRNEGPLQERTANTEAIKDFLVDYTQDLNSDCHLSVLRYAGHRVDNYIIQKIGLGSYLSTEVYLKFKFIRLVPNAHVFKIVDVEKKT
ncbi:hypothetical protein AGLY_009926 [Aphis glycines]|uniref:Uncharacterized protein n=1 Tax=Aphis glycines TaxID=307491 RepID=A0A6G0TGC1_APHGL|nr:hypothetical protein AGLY_009926 [Aphis glycines]